MINDILDLSKIEAGKMELYPTDFHFPSLIQGVVEISRVRADQKGIAFVYRPPAEMPEGVHADDKRLRQVLLNLLGNAIKFTDKGGVTFEVEALAAQAPSGNGQKGRLFRFRVEDTGIGISPEHLARIFVPFEQGGDQKRLVEGTGLGLAISNRIVQMMGSTIHVKSIVGQGSVFWLDVRLQEARDWKRTLTVVNNGRIVGVKGRQRNILVVDDRWENRSVIVNLLEPIGFGLLEAADGQEALAKAEEFRPDAIITDLAMPVLDGFALMRRIRETPELSGMIIIVSSASVFASDQHNSLKAGGNDFLAKPVRADDLLDKLAKHLSLEWIYDTGTAAPSSPPSPASPSEASNGDTDLVAPPEEDLAALLDLANRGRIVGLLERAREIEGRDARFAPFAKRMTHLAKDYQMKQIRDFSKRYRGT